MNRTIFMFSKEYRICIKACLHVEKFQYPSFNVYPDFFRNKTIRRTIWIWGQREHNGYMTRPNTCNYLFIKPYVQFVTGTIEVWIHVQVKCSE